MHQLPAVLLASLTACSVFGQTGATVIAQNQSGTSVTALNGSFLGQSVTTPPTGGPWDHIEFYFLQCGQAGEFECVANRSHPFALGGLYLLTQSYAGSAAGLSSATPGFVARATVISGGVWNFDPSVTLDPGTQYFLYMDTAFNGAELLYSNHSNHIPYAAGTLFLATSGGPGGPNYAPYATLDAVFTLTGNSLPGARTSARAATPARPGSAASSQTAGAFIYAASLAAVPTGAVPTGAFSFVFQSPGILTPSAGYPIEVTTEPGFTFTGTVQSGYRLTSVLLATNGTNEMFQVTLMNSGSGDSLVLNIIPDPASPLSSPGTYPLLMFPNLIVPGNPGSTSGDTGAGSLAITPQGTTPQTITFAALSDQTLGSPPLALTASASSGLAVTLTSTAASVCTVLGSTVTLVGAGVCSIVASQAGNAIYAAATPVTRSFTVTGKPVVVLVAAPNSSGPFYGMCCGVSVAASFTLSESVFVTTIDAVVLGSGTYDFTLQDALTGSITTFGSAVFNAPASGANTGTMTVNAALPSGTYYLVGTADRSSALAVPGWFVSDGIFVDVVGSIANGEWADNSAGSWSFMTGAIGGYTYTAPILIVRGFPASYLISQTITFDAIPDRLFGISPFQVAAQASSGLPVSIASTTPAVCRTASGLVTLLSVGTCSLTASQGGNADYTAAPPVSQTFKVSQPKPADIFTVAAGSPFTAGPGASSIAVGDFNGDGIPDLAISNSNAPSVTVLLGNGAGGFSSSINRPFGAGMQPIYVVAGDFNGDGIQDLAVANEVGGSVTVLLGDGSGAFSVATGPYGVGSMPMSLVVGDFNGDGIQDLATASFGSEDVTVLLGDGRGGFAAAAGSPFKAGAGPGSIVAGDFNGDGIQDLATANEIGNNLTVLLGDGSGGFTPATGSPFAAGANPSSLAAGDFNGDGIQDLAAANFGSNNVTVLLGDGLGGFAAAAGSPFVVGAQPISVAVGDLNGDGMPDLAVANFGGGNVTVLLGNGRGGFAAAAGSPFAVGVNPLSVIVGDFNRDAIQDLAAVSPAGNVTVLLGGKASALSIGKTHSINFFRQLKGATYSIAVANSAGSGSTSGTVTVAETLPPGLTLASMSGAGWTCSSNACTRSDSLAPGSSYPAITVAVNVDSDAPSSVTNQVSVSGGGSPNASASDITAISAFSSCDFRQNRSIGVPEVQLLVNEALAVMPAAHDLDGDGSVNVLDIQIEIDAVLGLGCGAK